MKILTLITFMALIACGSGGSSSGGSNHPKGTNELYYEVICSNQNVGPLSPTRQNLYFTAPDGLTLTSIHVFTDGAFGGDITIDIYDYNTNAYITSTQTKGIDVGENVLQVIKPFETNGSPIKLDFNEDLAERLYRCYGASYSNPYGVIFTPLTGSDYMAQVGLTFE